MSASLVGSEMCIRDRARRLHRLGRLLLGHAEGAGCVRGGPSALRRGRAVSYTHLTLPTICSV
eukprot:9301546-Alexandrium_andersonii.AAC.1